MADAAGTVRVGGCFHASWTWNVEYRYAEGSVVFRRDKARKGVLERVAVKSVLINDVHGVHDAVPMYVDTYNAMYGEEDLVPYAEAMALATTYYERAIAGVDAELVKLSCPWPGP